MPPAFTLPRWIEVDYQASMRKLMKSFLRNPLSDIDVWLHDLAHISQLPEFMDLASVVARRMTKQVNIQNAKTWREASARSQRSQMLYRLLQREMQGPVGLRVEAITRENARLISSIPFEVSQRLTFETMRAQQKGSRPETIAKMMATRFPELTSGRIHLISRTETAKASTALTEARSEDLDLPWYIWRTSEDQRVRHSHAHMDDVLIRWDDPASPEALVGQKSSLGKYPPGACPFCRCYPEPMLSMDDVSWPHKCYVSGRIQRLTRAQFQKINGVPSRIAA
jgi:SPP1 gp7 family putative phage head morphogenesis protein